MSAAAPLSLPERAPSVYLSVAGTDLPLPPEARVDLAYVYTYEFDPRTDPVACQIVVGGDYIEVPVAARARFQTNATVLTRSVYVAFNDPNQNTISVVPANATQAANLYYRYQFLIGTGTAYGPVQNRVVTTFPPLLGLPGYNFVLESTPADPGDAWDSQTVTVIRVPTGPSAQTAPRLSLVTPLLV